MIADIQCLRKSKGRGEGGLRKGAVRYEAIGRGVTVTAVAPFSFDCEVIVKLTTLMRKVYFNVPSS
jgi:hypothetical protein